MGPIKDPETIKQYGREWREAVWAHADQIIAADKIEQELHERRRPRARAGNRMKKDAAAAEEKIPLLIWPQIQYAAKTYQLPNSLGPSWRDVIAE